MQPGTEGVANLVFDVPKEARGVRGGTLDGEELEEGGQLRVSESLFEIRCRVEVKLGMGMGRYDFFDFFLLLFCSRNTLLARTFD